MASPAETFGLVLAVALPLGVAIYVVWRMVRLEHGVVFRTWLWAFLLLAYLSFLAFVLLESWFELGPLVGVVDGTLAVLAGWLGARYTLGTVVFQSGPKGRRMFHGRPILLAVWFLLFIARIALEVATFGHIFLLTPTVPPNHAVSGALLSAFIFLDALFAAATGLLIGGHLGLYLLYRRTLATPAPGPVTGQG